MLILAVGNILTASASGPLTLILSRVVLGIGMGAVWGLSAAIAPRLVASRNATHAVTISMSGVAAASVAGVPVGLAMYQVVLDGR